MISITFRNIPYGEFPRSDHICDCIWEKPPYSYFRKIAIALYVSRTNLALSLRPIACSVSGIWRPLSDHARTIKPEKLQSKRCYARASALHILQVHRNRMWVGPVDVTERANARQRERQGDDFRFGGVFQRITRRELLSAS